MIEVMRLAATDGGDGVRVTLDIDGAEEVYTVSAADHFLLGLKKGELDGERYLELTVAADRYAAVRAALRSLAAGQCSAKRLYIKLLAKHIRSEDAKYAVRFVRMVQDIEIICHNSKRVYIDNNKIIIKNSLLLLVV